MPELTKLERKPFFATANFSWHFFQLALGLPVTLWIAGYTGSAIQSQDILHNSVFIENYDIRKASAS